MSIQWFTPEDAAKHDAYLWWRCFAACGYDAELAATLFSLHILRGGR